MWGGGGGGGAINGPLHVLRCVFQLYRDAAECMNLLSQRLGSHRFFFGDAYVRSHCVMSPSVVCPPPPCCELWVGGPSECDFDLNGSGFWRRPSSLDAYVFGHLAPILQCKLPNGKLQQHLKTLDNLSSFCTNILLLYFPRDGRGEARRRRQPLRSE